MKWHPFILKNVPFSVYNKSNEIDIEPIEPIRSNFTYPNPEAAVTEKNARVWVYYRQ